MDLSLYEVDRDGTITLLVDGLNQPTSLEFKGKYAFVVTLGAEGWRIDKASRLTSD